MEYIQDLERCSIDAFLCVDVTRSLFREGSFEMTEFLCSCGRVSFYTSVGCDVFLFNYRGYGRSGGNASPSVINRDVQEARQLSVSFHMLFLLVETLRSQLSVASGCAFAMSWYPTRSSRACKQRFHVYSCIFFSSCTNCGMLVTFFAVANANCDVATQFA